MPDPIPGRALVTPRALRDLVRNAVLGVYGVIGLGGAARGPLAVLRRGQPGVHVGADGAVAVTLRLTVAAGLPVAEVARQVESAVRYAVRQATGREVDQLAIHVGRLLVEPGAEPPAAQPPAGPGPSDLAGSGTDVA